MCQWMEESHPRLPSNTFLPTLMHALCFVFPSSGKGQQTLLGRIASLLLWIATLEHLSLPHVHQFRFRATMAHTRYIHLVSRNTIQYKTATDAFQLGSTGRPKGVDVMHANVTNALLLEPARLNITVGSRVAQVLNVAFDMGTFSYENLKKFLIMP